MISCNKYLGQFHLASQKYNQLDQKNKSIITYVWIDGTGQNLRAKSYTLDYAPSDVKSLKIWESDGSSTGQANEDKSDIYLYPVAMYPDPFRAPGPNKLVFCDVYYGDNTPVITNKRVACKEIMDKVTEHKPWFGFEQEYVLIDLKTNRPLGWPKMGYPAQQGPYYCGVGSGKIVGRQITQAFYRCCLYADINIYGDNVEVLPSQWEYQLGPTGGIEAADELWISRYILHRVAEDFGVKVTFEPKPIPSPWNGTGLHTNFSTNLMREVGGMEHIKKAINRLEYKHSEHMCVYDSQCGKGNLKRLSGKCETSSFNSFTSSISGRNTSIRIPKLVADQGFGYLEDRRPAGDADPYLIISTLIKTILL